MTPPGGFKNIYFSLFSRKIYFSPRKKTSRPQNAKCPNFSILIGFRSRPSQRSLCGRKDAWFDNYRDTHAAEGRRTQQEHEDNRRNLQQEVLAKRRRLQEQALNFSRQRLADQQTPAHEDTPRELGPVACKAWRLGRCSRTDHPARHPTDTAIVCCSERLPHHHGFSTKFGTCPFETKETECPYEHPESKAAEIAATAADLEAFVDRTRAAETEDDL